MWRNWNPRTLPAGIQNGATALENSLAVCSSVKHRITIQPSSLTLGWIAKNWENRHSNKQSTWMFIAVLFKDKSHQMSMNWRVAKQKAIPPHNRISCSHQKEWSPDTGDDVGEPYKGHAKWKKVVTTEDHMGLHSMFRTGPVYRPRVSEVVPGAGGWGH